MRGEIFIILIQEGESLGTSEGTLTISNIHDTDTLNKYIYQRIYNNKYDRTYVNNK